MPQKAYVSYYQMSRKLILAGELFDGKYKDPKLIRRLLNLKEISLIIQHLYQLAKAEGEIKRLLKFVIVGISGVFVNEGILFLLVEKGGLIYLISSVFSIQSAILTNFTLNHLWTFNDRMGGSVSLFHRLIRFQLVSIGGAAVNLSILFILTNFFGIYYLTSNLIAIAVAVVANFLGNNLWTWGIKIND